MSDLTEQTAAAEETEAPVSPNGANQQAPDADSGKKINPFEQLADIRAKAQAQTSETQPEVQKPLMTPDQAVFHLETLMKRLPPDMQKRLMATMNDLLASDWLDADTWAGIGYVLKIATETQWDTIKRRLRGQYEVDEWGFDEDFMNFVLPIIGFLFNYYWRVEMTGL